MASPKRLAEVERIQRRFLDGKEGMEPVDRDDLIRRAREGAVTVLDVRPTEEYAAGHIPGAPPLPLSELQRRLADLPKDQEIVAYCRGPYCVLSVQAVEMLRAMGFPIGGQGRRNPRTEHSLPSSPERVHESHRKNPASTP